MKRPEATATYIKHLIDERVQELSSIEKALSAMQARELAIKEELKSLRHIMTIVDPPESGRDSDLPPPPENVPAIPPLPAGTTTKHFELADRLFTVAHRHSGLITTRQAFDHLLEAGLVTEQSGRFQVWHALSNTGKFKRIARGKYEAVSVTDSVPSQFDENGTPEIEPSFGKP